MDAVSVTATYRTPFVRTSKVSLEGMMGKTRFEPGDLTHPDLKINAKSIT